jgi:N-formylglutamate amidohydrolase
MNLYKYIKRIIQDEGQCFVFVQANLRKYAGRKYTLPEQRSHTARLKMRRYAFTIRTVSVRGSHTYENLCAHARNFTRTLAEIQSGIFGTFAQLCMRGTKTVFIVGN